MNFIYDTETDGLLNELTKMHCAVFKQYGEDKWYVFSGEPLRDDFKESLTKAHNVSFFGLDVLSRFLHSPSTTGLICHNQLGFDLEVFKQLGYISSYDLVIEPTLDGRPCEIIDTLVWSRSLYPDRPLPNGCAQGVQNPVTGKLEKVSPHGLQGWAYRTKGKKPFIEDWRNLSVEEYVNRCFEDVIINEATYEALLKEISEKAIGSQGWEAALRDDMVDSYLFFKQEMDGFPFDKQAAQKLVESFDVEMSILDRECQQSLGKRHLPTAKQPAYPAKPFKKCGSLSSNAIKYGEKIGITDEEKLKSYIVKVVRGDAEPVILTEQCTLAHQDDVKLHLFNNGWQPTLFRTKDATRDQFKRERKPSEVNEILTRYIKEVKLSPYKKLICKELGFNIDRGNYDNIIERLKRKARFLPTSPQLKDERGALCPNLDKTAGEFGRKVAKWLSIRNRRTVIKSFENEDKGWLNNPRLDVDSRLGQGNSGRTNTKRYKHRTIVNVPSVDALYGHEMRSLFTAAPNHLVLGFDASALENRVAGHYASAYDNGAYAELVLNGDPETGEDCHVVNAKAYSVAAGREISRGEGKAITYACLYGAQPPKLGAMLGGDRELGKLVQNAFWDTNEGLKLLKGRLEEYWVKTGNKYILGLDGSKIFTRSKHSLVNALFQSAGAIIMSKTMVLIAEKCKELEIYYWRSAFVHDEGQFQVPKKEVEFKVFSSLDEAVAYDDGLLWSKPRKVSENKVVRYYHPIGEIALQSLLEAGKFYKMSLDITGEYMVGRNWAETH